MIVDNMHEAKTRLSELVRAVEERDETVVRDLTSFPRRLSYVWKTEKNANSCRRLTLTFSVGGLGPQTAEFSFST